MEIIKIYNLIVMMVCAHIIAFFVGRQIAMNKGHLDEFVHKTLIKLQLRKEVPPLPVKEEDKNFIYGNETIKIEEPNGYPSLRAE